jgi:hypothetical protein
VDVVVDVNVDGFQCSAVVHDHVHVHVHDYDYDYAE